MASAFELKMESLEQVINNQFQALSNKPCFGTRSSEYDGDCGICMVVDECRTTHLEAMGNMEVAITLEHVAVENAKVAAVAEPGVKVGKTLEEALGVTPKRSRVPFDWSAATAWMIENKPTRLGEVVNVFAGWLGDPIQHKATAYGNAGRLIQRLAASGMVEYDDKTKVITWK